MESSITNYRTSFKVVNTDGDKFRRLKQCVYGWILQKEKDEELRQNKTSFLSRVDLRNLPTTRSRIRTNYFRSDEFEAWAVKYTEQDREQGRLRFWHTDIGLRTHGDDVIVSVQNSFSWNKENITANREDPPPSVPKVVRYVVKDFTVYSGRNEFRLTETPLRLGKLDQAEALAQFIQSPERSYPLIVFNGATSESESESALLARKLTGKCQVVLVDDNAELSRRVRSLLPENFWTAHGNFRVYFPFNRRNNPPERHRWFSVADSAYQSMREVMIAGLLSNNTVTEHHAVESITDISRLISRNDLVQRATADDGASAELQEFFKLYEELERERDDYRLLADRTASERDEAIEESKRLRWETGSLREELDQSRKGSAPAEIAQLLKTLPQTLLEVIELAKEIFAQKLCITEQALESAKDCESCTVINEGWRMLFHLQEELYRMKFDSDKKLDLEREFANQTGLDLAMSEGRKTQQDRKLMNLRKIRFEGREYDITPHVKYGNRSPKMLRLHFAFDEEKKRIIVGFLGSHLENATSRKIK
jgi:hypothetical protein